MQLSWHMFSVGVVTFAAAVIFTMVQVYFTLVRERIGRSYPYYSTFIGTLIIYLSVPVVSMLPFDKGKVIFHLSGNFLLFAVGVPALTQALYIQSGVSLGRWKHLLPYCLGFAWATFHLLTFELTYPKTYFDIAPVFNWQQLGLTAEHVYYSHVALIMAILVLPCLHLLAHNNKASKANIYIIGALNFCFFICLGIVFKAWAVYYVGTSLTALIWAWAAFSDIQKTNDQLQRNYSHESRLASAQFASSGNALSMVDLYPEQINENYPFRLQAELLEQIKTASLGLIPQTCEQLQQELSDFANEQLDILKARIREILFLMYDSAILQHGDATLLSALEQKGQQVDDSVSPEQLFSVLNEQACRLAAYYREHQATELTNPLVDSTKKHILAYYHKELSISSIAESLNVSRSYLMATFKKSTQQTINQYLAEVRIKKSQSLLLTSTVTQTAYDVGFSNPNYFATVFKKHTGLTPKQYQAQAKSENART
ncbi:helix-turn-helix transcriptional regulator [Neiella sp. HB171785]|uniref:Helix-turn-helix transcriptional regulator n=1 Tax=Neiella litorisoli TaxID=2771431 RepID=A0A8J6QMK3_9GAMM|nr:AraC family transcriptional regulator [Neiella litorisoli]MBD1390956.1 helix-turn-helix transcriptional regulator [Neiella litorisoli]